MRERITICQRNCASHDALLSRNVDPGTYNTGQSRQIRSLCVEQMNLYHTSVPIGQPGGPATSLPPVMLPKACCQPALHSYRLRQIKIWPSRESVQLQYLELFNTFCSAVFNTLW